MAKTVRIWDTETCDYKPSAREYDRYEVTAIAVADDSWGTDRGVSLTLYADALTGVVTTDVAAYERSLAND